MPYLTKALKDVLDDKTVKPNVPGSLNYAITKVVIEYIEEVGLSYTSINDVMGAIESAKLEFYRRVAVPYEDLKIGQNGDVYPREFKPWSP